MYYYLSGKTPIKVNDVLEWGKHMADSQTDKNKIVRKTYLKPKNPLRKPKKGAHAKNQGTLHRINAIRAIEVEISTVFLGLDHSFNRFWTAEEVHQPVLFETLVFGGKRDGKMCRYCTWEEAEEGHKSILELLQQ